MKKKICLVSATPLTFHLFMKEHLNKLAEWSDVTIVYNQNYHKNFQPVKVFAKTKHIEIVRQISILKDLIALGELIYFFKSKTPFLKPISKFIQGRVYSTNFT